MTKQDSATSYEELGWTKIGDKRRLLIPVKAYRRLKLNQNTFILWTLEGGKLILYRGEIQFQRNKKWD